MQFGAPYTSDDPRFATSVEERCEEGIFTKDRCTTMAVSVCVDCQSPICEEHRSWGNRCPACLGEHEAAKVVAA